MTYNKAIEEIKDAQKTINELVKSAFNADDKITMSELYKQDDALQAVKEEIIKMQDAYDKKNDNPSVFDSLSKGI